MSTPVKRKGPPRKFRSLRPSPSHSRRKSAPEILLHCEVSVPPYERKVILAAATAALEGIPRGVWKKRVGLECPPLNLSVIGPAAMKKLNRQYRKKNRPTDVLSFSRIEERFPGAPLVDLGDVVLCRQVAHRQAREYEIAPAVELAQLTIHGVLHLFGYDHEKTEAQAKVMFALQRKVLYSLMASIG